MMALLPAMAVPYFFLFKCLFYLHQSYPSTVVTYCLSFNGFVLFAPHDIGIYVRIVNVWLKIRKKKKKKREEKDKSCRFVWLSALIDIDFFYGLLFFILTPLLQPFYYSYFLFCSSFILRCTCWKLELKSKIWLPLMCYLHR